MLLIDGRDFLAQYPRFDYANIACVDPESAQAQVVEAGARWEGYGNGEGQLIGIDLALYADDSIAPRVTIGTKNPGDSLYHRSDSSLPRLEVTQQNDWYSVSGLVVGLDGSRHDMDLRIPCDT